MGRIANDGRGRIGGRAKGTKNKPQQPLNDWAAGLVNKRRAQFEKDLDALTPQERAAVLGPIIAATVSGSPVQEPRPLTIDQERAAYQQARERREQEKPAAQWETSPEVEAWKNSPPLEWK